MSIDTISEASQYLSFELGEEVFALDISKVREVLDYTKVTRVPQMPAYMLGVINLRGGVVPLVDMRLKLGMDRIEPTINTCIIIVEASLDDERVVIGALADSVREVFDMNAEDIKPAPTLGTHLHTEFLLGMGKRHDEFILMLDIDRVFSSDEIAAIRSGRDIGALQEDDLPEEEKSEED